MHYQYLNENYTKTEGLLSEQLEAELRAVFVAYPEYHDPEYGTGQFSDMVATFASDDFYKLHYVARRYLTW